MRSICTSIVATLALAGTSFAATINVPGDHATIQGAINASSNGDVIAIAAGTYYEHTLNPNGKAITIGSASGNPDVTIDAQQGGSVFMIESGEDDGTVIKDLVITGGSNYDGGGIWCYNSTPTISNCTIMDNTANYFGGGILCDNSNPTISNCTIEGNTTYSQGGGIYCYYDSNPTISGCTISGNTAYSQGGGIFCYDSNPTITGCTFTSNMPDTIVGDFNTSEPASTTGACCVSSGCHALTEDACAGMGGTWLGEGGSCDNCPASCMGDTDGNGVVNIEDLLNMLGSWGPCP